ncbi:MULTISPECIES: CheR family methyltransferase [unclassified Janthinobacterium]|uniref:CheR family methyltransferase n=1 Tax=unclassified Janthinobacterium TaxID=2610881 RepID=UPI0008F4A53F|nr:MULTISPECIES: CheR family methyltransferase [unclassified Janthinobacterium]APA68422.1 chemotaxis protein CheR [Janthinobacterium sp. 1_2014MBL_MicDiv]MDN2710171.1 protein-glutamate O-methyltransferase CheR [Janthinobacterium sp. SUN118]
MSARHTDAQLQALMEAIYQRYSYDFRDYTLPSQRRRLNHALDRFQCADLPAMQQLVIEDPAAFGRLLQILTVPVTQMFRDPAFFLALREDVVPVLKTYPSPTIWVAGCCTGEEALSLAIVLHEEGLLERSRIYATDINPQALATAVRGTYPLHRMEEYGNNYREAGGLGQLAEYYTVEHATARFPRQLLDKINFADHSLATDSVFVETQLVLCRNVLIYFNKQLQDRALGLFHESLCHRGFLGLGSKESPHFTRFSTEFEPLPGVEKLYRKRAPSRAAPSYAGRQSHARNDT